MAKRISLDFRGTYVHRNHGRFHYTFNTEVNMWESRCVPGKELNCRYFTHEMYDHVRSGLLKKLKPEQMNG